MLHVSGAQHDPNNVNRSTIFVATAEVYKEHLSHANTQ